jgi:5-methylcytosine-specific restriction endonuclease McrA
MYSSIIWKIGKNELQELLNKSNSIVAVLISLGLKPYSGNHRTLSKRIIKDNLNIGQLTINRKKLQKARLKSSRNELTIQEVFKKNGTFTSGGLKRKILKYSLMPYCCKICNNLGLWNDKKLSLQLDHIDGDNTNNLLNNLRFLCPNCHTQTSTYSGKVSKVKLIKKCNNCINTICKHSKSGLCKKCASFKLRKIVRPEISILEEKIKSIGYEATGKLYSVSGNTVKKWFHNSAALT